MTDNPHDEHTHGLPPNKREAIKQDAEAMWEALQHLSHEHLTETEAKRAEGRVYRIKQLFTDKGWFGPSKATRVALMYIQEMYGVSGTRHNIHYRGSPINQSTLQTYREQLADAINQDLGYDPTEYDLDNTDFTNTDPTPGHNYLLGEDILRKHYGR